MDLAVTGLSARGNAVRSGALVPAALMAGLVLAGCDQGTAGSPAPSAPPSIPPPASSSDPYPHLFPTEPMRPLPEDPCALVSPARIRFFAHLGEVEPTRKKRRRGVSCEWQTDRDRRGVTLISVTVFDVRPFTAEDTCERGTVINDPAGTYCRSEDRHGIKIVRANLTIDVSWHDTRISRATPDQTRTSREEQITAAFAAQLLARLPA